MTSPIDTAWFQGLIKDKGYSQRGFARLVNMDHAALSLMLNGKRKMSVGEAGTLAQFLDKPVAEVLRRAGVEVRASEQGTAPMTAPATGRTADENEMREFRKALALACNDPGHFVGFKGERSLGEWQVDALLSGPLAPILQEAATARKERDEARRYAREVGTALVGLTCDGSEFYRRAGEDFRVDPAACVDYVRHQGNARFATIKRFAERAQAAEQEAATLRARLQEAEKALRPFSAAVFNDNGDVTISTGHVTTRDWLAAKRARAALAAPIPQTQEAGDHEPR